MTSVTLADGTVVAIGEKTRVNGGDLTVNADGTYVFNRDSSILNLGPNLTTNFSYTVDDGKGGVVASSASLVVELPGLSLPPAPVAAPAPPIPAPPPPAPAAPVDPTLLFAQQVIAGGSHDDGYANNQEMVDGFAFLGLALQQTGVSGAGGVTSSDVTGGLPHVLSDIVAPVAGVIAGISNFFGGGGSDPGPGSTPEAALNRLIASYGTTGNGGLSAEELAQALTDGAFDVGADTVTINNDVVQAKLAQGGAANIAARVIAAGSQDDALANHSELVAGFAAAGWDLPDGGDLAAVIAGWSGNGGALDAGLLQAAIATGAIALQANGAVVVDPSKVPGPT